MFSWSHLPARAVDIRVQLDQLVALKVPAKHHVKHASRDGGLHPLHQLILRPSGNASMHGTSRNCSGNLWCVQVSTSPLPHEIFPGPRVAWRSLARVWNVQPANCTVPPRRGHSSTQAPRHREEEPTPPRPPSAAPRQRQGPRPWLKLARLTKRAMLKGAAFLNLRGVLLWSLQECRSCNHRLETCNAPLRRLPACWPIFRSPVLQPESSVLPERN